MIRDLFKYIFLFFLIFFFYSLKAANNKIIVKVDNQIISSYELKNKINTELILRNLDIDQENINKIKNFALQSLINLRVKEKEILKYKSIEIEKVDISNQLKLIASDNINELKKNFSENNLSYEIFVQELKINTAWRQLIFQIFKDKVVINENEIDKQIKNIKNDSINVREFDLSEIEISYKSQTDKKSKIEDITKKIKELGFEKSVQIFSESETAKNNGNIGYVNEESLSADIYEVLKNLGEGDVSDPIIRIDKIIFLKINKIKSSKNNEIDIDKLKKSLINKKKNDLLKLYSASYLSKLKTNSYIEFQ